MLCLQSQQVWRGGVCTVCPISQAGRIPRIQNKLPGRDCGYAAPCFTTWFTSHACRLKGFQFIFGGNLQERSNFDFPWGRVFQLMPTALWCARGVAKHTASVSHKHLLLSSLQFFFFPMHQLTVFSMYLHYFCHCNPSNSKLVYFYVCIPHFLKTIGFFIKLFFPRNLILRL